MKNLKIKTFVGILFITIIIASFASNTVFAAINHTYGDTVVVSDTSLDEKAVNAGLVEIFAQMVYWLASWIESTVADAFAILTGENEFPWADRVIFNSVAFLDVNFINPADGSLFKEASGSNTALATVIKKVYGSVMTICIGFLGVVVSLMAIRLSISIIASEKAKYKQAITRFSIAIVMLFCVHYIITIVFYINEKLVETASSILLDTIQEQSLSNNLDLSAKMNYEQTAQNFIDANEKSGTVSVDKLKENMYVVDQCPQEYVNLRNNIATHLQTIEAFKSYENMREYVVSNYDIAGRLLKSLSGTRYSIAKGSSEEAEGDNDTKQSVGDAIVRLAFDIWVVSGREVGTGYKEVNSDATITSYRDKYVNGYGTKALKVFNKYTNSTLSKQMLTVRDLSKNNLVFIFDTFTYDKRTFAANSGGATCASHNRINREGGIGSWGACYYIGENGKGGENIAHVTPFTDKEKCTLNFSMIVSSWRRYKVPYFNKIINLYNAYSRTKDDPKYVNPDISDEPIAIISSLGSYFKNAVWGYETETDGDNVVVTGWAPSNFTISGAIIYAVFIFQSIMFFLAYIRRFFYVTILAMFAPAVVIYDFLVRSIS